MKSQVENLTVSVAGLEQHKSGALTNVGVELNPIRQDIVQLRSQYGNLQEFFNETEENIRKALVSLQNINLITFSKENNG